MRYKIGGGCGFDNMDKMNTETASSPEHDEDREECLAEIDKAAAKVLQGYDWSIVSNTKK